MNDAIALALKLLLAGDVVAFPTETVYGLGADATNASAVRKIFQLKGRPSTNPLICHVADADVAKRYAHEWPENAQKLAEKFWPGPLTIVLPKTREIVDEATAGLQTVGLRAPDHELTLELLRAFGKPLAGPSANKSTHVSPTTAQHVRDEFGDDVFVLDGGPCRVGIESTVIALGDVPRILRPGGVSREQIESVIGSVEMTNMVTEVTTPANAPGQHLVHYAPRTPAFRFPYRSPSPGEPSMLIANRRPEEYAHELYATLRKLDQERHEAIYIELPPDTPEWTAIRDRIIRATKNL